MIPLKKANTFDIDVASGWDEMPAVFCWLHAY